MFRSKVAAFAVVAAVCFLSAFQSPSGSALGQESATVAPGFTPNTVIQDENSLTEKVSYFIGFNMMMNLNRQQTGKVNMQEVLEGMKAAQSGKDMSSFIAGYQMISDFERQGVELTLDKVFNGMTTASAGKELGMTEEEVNALKSAFQKVVEKRQTEKLKLKSAENIAAAEAYMAKNLADNPNVKTLEGGIQYEILTEGTGEIPTVSNEVKLDYHGTFLDGTVFDSSIKPPSGRPAEPIKLNVGGFVPGFSKVLQNMKVGSKWRVVIPGQQAYGARGDGTGMIGPNQALIFEISLLEIVQ